MRQRNSARRSRKWVRNACFECVEERTLLTGFFAYNGMDSSDLTNPNTTFYAPLAGSDAAGPLTDVDTGEVLTTRISTLHQGVRFGGNGVNPAPGTDAHDIFDSYVDFSAGSLRSLELEPGDLFAHQFEELNQGATYQFAGTAVRGDSNYTDRWTLVTLMGADSASPAHTDNPGVVTEGLGVNQVAIWTGANHTADQGVVAAWVDIEPGEDGEFSVISTQYRGAVPTSIHSTGLATGTKGYGLASIRLVEDVTIGPPIVENRDAEGISAFEATIGGRVVSTGGDAPDVTLYWGTMDANLNAGAWENSTQLGEQARFFSTELGNLEDDTTYYYRSFATNNMGTAWSPDAGTFTTLVGSAPTVSTDLATGIGAFAAELQASLESTGNDVPLVSLYFGDNDGGTNVDAWDEFFELGELQAGDVNQAVDDLQPLTQYYYRLFAVNRVGASWSNTQSFSTTDIPPVQISELMTDNARTITTRLRDRPADLFVGDTLTPDWFEIANPKGFDVDFSGYSVTDDLDQLDKWVIPEGTVIPAGGYRLFFASGLDVTDPRLDERSAMHTNFTLSDTGGEELALVNPEGEVISVYDPIPDQSEDISYGSDLVGNFRYYPQPTPGESNANDTPKTPVIDQPNQTFTGSLTVTITAGAATDTIHYTLDERPPNDSSPIYTEPLQITNTTQLRAIAIGANGKESTRVSRSFIELSPSVTNRTSNLPLVIVDTFGDNVGTSFADTFIGIIEPDGDTRTDLTQEFDLSTRAGFRIRGSSSAGILKEAISRRVLGREKRRSQARNSRHAVRGRLDFLRTKSV